jgi:hypothetical protein
MAILQSSTGKFYDMDDNALEGKEMKPEDLPQELQRPGPGMGGGPGGGGQGGLAGLIQVNVNLPSGGGPSRPAPGGADAESKGADDDVSGHWRRHFYYWRNCWRNWW